MSTGHNEDVKLLCLGLHGSRNISITPSVYDWLGGRSLPVDEGQGSIPPRHFYVDGRCILTGVALGVSHNPESMNDFIMFSHRKSYIKT